LGRKHDETAGDPQRRTRGGTAMSYDEILLASDGSDAAVAAVEHALSLAEAFDATLHVVYVLDVAEHAPGQHDEGEHPKLVEAREDALEGPLERAEAAGVDATSVAVRRGGGDVGDALVAYADEHDVDLVVTGTHARSGLDRLIVGSVAEHLVRTAPVPVVTVRPDQPDAGGE
jgi:nucleotide-binding universal stress UspA family protein